MSTHVTVESLSQYVDAALAPADRRRLETHLECCLACRQRLAGLRGVVSRLEGLPQAVPPPDLAVRIRRGVDLLGEPRGWRHSAALPWRGLLAGPPLAHIFALVLALGAIVYLFAFGVSSQRQRATRIVLPASAQPEKRLELAVAEAAPPAAAADTVRLLGGVFDRQEGAWVERGLADRTPDERLELRELPPAAELDRDLAAVAALDAPLRLRIGESVVEIAISDPR